MENMNTKEDKKFQNMLLIFLIIFLPVIANKKGNFIIIKYHFSYIDLIVKGPGNAKLFEQDDSNESCEGIDIPDEMEINNETQIEVVKEYDLKNEENYVRLIWNHDNIRTIHCLFHKCDKITYADLSHFNSSLVESISDLFHSCKSLISVNFNNFDTSKVTDMHMMFRKCTSLVSIDLSNLDTSKVARMQYMFEGCSSLESINLLNKYDTSNVEKMNYMFCGCSSLLSLDLSNFNTEKVNNMEYMFENCKKIRYINLSDFNTSNVKSMYYMFHNCLELTSIDVSNFDTSKVTTLAHMFWNCKKLKSINTSNFYTPEATNSSFMFSGCEQLTYIDISKFDYTKLTILSLMFNGCKNLISIKFPKSKAEILYKIGSLFKNCESLISVDLSNFVTTNVIYMDYMFFNCKSLTSINLSNFDTSSVIWYHNMFKGCLNLEYINLKNAKENNRIQLINDVFTDIPENIVICINETNAPRLTELIKNESCYTNYCGDDWIKHQKKLINGRNECVESCNNNEDYEYEFNNKCYNSCEYGFYYDKDNSQQKKCKCKLDKCLLCSNIESIKNLCISCNEGYYPKENDNNNLFPYINCYKDPKGYYLDNINKDIYRECYYTCNICNIEGDYIKHNCLECKLNYNFELSYQDSLNCYENCTNYYYFDENRSYFCTINSSCPEEYNKLVLHKDNA